PLYEDDRDDHASLSWTGCYDDNCLVHIRDKEGSGWFPKDPRRARKKRQDDVRIAEINTSETREQDLESKNPMEFKVKINGVTANALLDSGADKTLLAPRWVTKTNTPYQERDEPLWARMADGQLSQEQSQIKMETWPVTLEIQGISEKRKLDIMPIGRHDIII